MSRYIDADDDLLNTLTDVIDDIPKRKHAQWIYKPDMYDDCTYECSYCKEAFTFIEGTPKDNLYNFCPNCGCEMDGKDQTNGC